MFNGKKFFTKIHDGNLAYHVNDKKENVDKNRRVLSKKFGFDLSCLKYMKQVHGNTVKLVTATSSSLSQDCDALITNEKNVMLMVMVADCIPILFYDNKKNVIAAVHAGRNSTFLNIVKEVVEKMQKEFFCKSEDIEVEMGPSIQACCYEVNDEMRNFVEDTYSKDFCKNNCIDLQAINVFLLKQMGVTKIKRSKVCTKCAGEEYFSYRNNAECGRFAGLIVME